jgi:hypothetical protein
MFIKHFSITLLSLLSFYTLAMADDYADEYIDPVAPRSADTYIPRQTATVFVPLYHFRDPAQNLPSRIPHSTSFRFFASEYLALIPMTPDFASHFDPILTDPVQMRYFGSGIPFTPSLAKRINTARAYRNLENKTSFTWLGVTQSGTALRVNVWLNADHMEMAFCVLPSQGGRRLAQRAAECVVSLFDEETHWFATAHPLNTGSMKTLDSIHCPDGSFLFHQGEIIPEKFGKGQDRIVFKSKPQNISWFSLYDNTRKIL